MCWQPGHTFDGSSAANVIADGRYLVVILVIFPLAPRPLRRCYLKPKNLIAPRRKKIFFGEKRTCKKSYVIAEEKGDYMYVLATIKEVDDGLLISTHKSNSFNL